MRQYKERLHFQNQASVKPDLFVMSSDRKSNAEELDPHELVVQCDSTTLLVKVITVPAVNHGVSHTKQMEI